MSIPYAEIFQIILITIKMAFFSTSISLIIGIPMGFFLGVKSFRFKGIIMRLINTLMGLPPVVAGLLVFFLLSRSGPLGKYRLLYSVTAMIIAQIVLITPIVIGLISSVISEKYPLIRETAIGINMSKNKLFCCLMHECRTQIFSIALLGFGRSIAEVGAVSIVGGNVQYKTRVMTTAIMLETNKGNFEFAIALGAVLLLLSFIINSLALSLQVKYEQ